jgi:ApaG protein
VSTSEITTNGISVTVESVYSPEHSAPARSSWFFLYTIRITNESHQSAQLLSRHWVITDATGHREEVKGPGVVGEQPVLEPGESFEYTSGCPLSTPFGTMRGRYLMELDDETRFEAEIATFELSQPNSLH